MTTSDHRHSNNHKQPNNIHHSNDNKQANDAEIDSGMIKKKKKNFV
jgi:hypothetical protein